MNRVRAKRATPRRRDAPRWNSTEWEEGNALLMARAAGCCECCGVLLGLVEPERHHRVRRRDGGDRVANLMILLPDCHSHWTRNPEEARRRGIIVSAFGADPDGVPVLWRGRELCLLDDEGGRTPV